MHKFTQLVEKGTRKYNESSSLSIDSHLNSRANHFAEIDNSSPYLNEQPSQEAQ